MNRKEPHAERGRMSRRHVLGSGAAMLAFGSANSPASKKAGLAEVASRTSQAGIVNVAFVISDGVTVIDFTGPWEVFQDASSASGDSFNLYTVAPSREPVTASAGLTILPKYTFKDAPDPAIVVVPAQSGGARVQDYIISVSGKAETTLSVCTGAFQLAHAGLLDGLTATTHHDFCDRLQRDFPKIQVVRRVRFVDHGGIATAAGLTAGIDLALHIVERRMGPVVAKQTAAYMEYETHSRAYP